MITSQSLDRKLSSAGNQGSRPFSPYSRPLTTGGSEQQDKSTLIWRDFQHSVKKRKAIIERFTEAALGTATPLSVLKKSLLDLRQITLAVVEDALEVEYQQRVAASASGTRTASKKGSRTPKLPPINSYNTMHEHEEIYALADIINDCEELFAIPNVKVMLPMNFPSIRNPFMLGKTIDELATIVPPHPEPGNVEDELKSLELLRFKRASRALLRAEAQLLNRLPLNLYDIEKLLNRMKDDSNIEMLIRCTCTLIDNDRVDTVDQEADLACLLSPLFTVEAHELLRKLNEFRGITPMRIDVKVLLKQKLRSCTFDYLMNESVPKFLYEWIYTIIGGRETPFKQQFDEIDNSHNVYEPSQQSLHRESTMSRQGARSNHSRSTGLNNITSIDHLKSYEKDDTDLVSVVDSTNGFIKTHENIHSPSEPRKKLKMKPPLSPTQDMAQQTSLIHSEDDEENNHNKSPQGTKWKSPKKERKIEFSPGDVQNGNNKKINISIKRKIREEVEKALKEMNKNAPFQQRNNDYGEGDDSQPGNFDALSSVRYELNKMQQELLRRQVLDPKHYTVTSIDAVTHAHRGLTVSNLNAFDPLEKRHQNTISPEQSLMPVEIATKTIKIPSKEDPQVMMTLLLSILFRPETNDLLCTLSLSYEDAVRFGFIRDESKTNLRVDRSPQILLYFIVSTLIFSKLNQEYTIEDLIETKPEHRKRLMQNIFQQMEIIAQQKPLPRGLLVLPVNRSLFTRQFVEDNLLVDLLISRTIECDGLQVQCTPIAGLFGSGIGPVTLTISDHELEVLFISQHGLFLKAKLRWESMVIIASWIAGRLHVKKVATQTNIEVFSPKPAVSIVNDLESITSQLTFSPRKNEAGEVTAMAVASPTKAMSASYKGKEAVSNNQSLLMLEIFIDRHIDISDTLLEHWKARNVTKILGLEVHLSAYQDLEMMEVRITIIVPSKLTHKKLLDEADIHQGKANTKKGLGTLEDYSSDEDEYAYEEDDTTKFELSYRLTRAELLIFGSAELIENKKIGMSKNTSHDATTALPANAPPVNIIEENHPEKMIWNILNRLKIVFKGSRNDPFKSATSAKDPENWSITYERVLVRDVKTVSQMILMLSASAVGGDLVIEGHPVDANVKQKIGKKVVTEPEIKEMVYSEGWEMKLLNYIHRKDISNLLLDKLKIVKEGSLTSTTKEFRIELESYVETRMILITRIGSVRPLHQQKGGGGGGGSAPPDVDHELELGYVEINNHHTLSDLRIIIKHELDSEDLPAQYRFLYKGTTCSLRQETFRRAWECLPICHITPKQVITSEAGTETDDIAKRRLEKIPKKEGPKIPRLTKNQRRVPGKYVAVPIPTLCIVEEGKSIIYLLNEAKELFAPGEIIRLGNPKGRDYIVFKIGTTFTIPIEQQNSNNNDAPEEINLKSIEIEPEYDLIGEPDFSIPIFKNYAFPNHKKNGLYMNEKGNIIQLLKSKEAMGYHYQIPKELINTVYPELAVNAVSSSAKGKLLLKKSSTKGKSLLTTSSKSRSVADLLAEDEEGNDNHSENDNDSLQGRVLLARTATGKNQKSLKGIKNLGSRVFTDVWIWKCIPAKEDRRPKWKQLYDDGNIQYSYEYTLSDDYFEHFRVKAYYAYLEILCTDSRCSYLTLYSQRVNEMKNIPIEYYTKLIFDKVTDWSPVYKKGIEKNKFIKLIREVNAFPDLKRPARLAQIDNFFIKTVKSSFGIVQKYISYAGFCQVVKELAVIRFPPKKKDLGGGGGGGENSNNKSDVATGGGGTGEGESVTVGGTGGGNDANDDQSVMTDDLSSIASGDGEPKNKGRRQRKTAFTGGGSTANNSNNASNVDADLNSANVLANVDPEYIQFAYQKFILDYLMMFPTWYDAPWKEVKLVAMQKESIRYCAITRIIAVYRGFHQKKLYRYFLKQHIILQAHIRRKLTTRRINAMMAILFEDYLFRQRYYYMTKIQSIVRRFLKRCWYLNVLEQLKRQQMILVRARRQKKKKINELRRKSLLYSEVKKMNGVTVLLRVYRRDPRNYTKDFGINVEAYIPKSQGLFKFPIEDPELRSYLQILLEKPALSTGDILNKKNIQNLLITRLIVLKSSSKNTLPTIIFSRHALGQKGEKILTHAISIQKEYFICKIFETIEDITVQCYHAKTCKIFTAKITIKELHRWIKDEFIMETVSQRNKEKQKLLEAAEEEERKKNPFFKSAGNGGGKNSPKKIMPLNNLILASNDLNSQADDNSNHTEEIAAKKAHEKERKRYEIDVNRLASKAADPNNPNSDNLSVITAGDDASQGSQQPEDELFEIKLLTPSLLKPENKKKYYEWILRHLVIDTRNKKFQLLFKNQLEKSRKKEMLIKLQAAWRRALVTPIILQKLDEVYLKIRSSPQEPNSYYYLHRYSGVSSWAKPPLLRHHDLITQPTVSHWVPIHYQQVGIIYTHYVNPFTGKYTHLIPDQAIRVIQRLARRFLLKAVRMPKDHFLKAASIYKNAYKLYQTSFNPQLGRRKLAHVINYAIVLHVIECNESEAKEVYREAVELSESNPLVTRCYGLYLISTCEAPMLLNRDRALLLLADAKRKDENHSRFEIAYYLFELGVLRQPRNHIALVNLALVDCLIYGNNYRGEKLLRRALALAPFEERVMEIWKYLKERFPEKVLLYNPLSRINRMKASVDAAVQKAGKELKLVHGRPVVENDQWAGWVYVPDDKFKASKKIKEKIPYWYNPADGTESLDPPDFQEQWKIRKERSHYQVTEYGLEQYYDPLTFGYFQYHALTDSYS